MKNKKQTKKNKICIFCIVILLTFVILLLTKNKNINSNLSATINTSTNYITIECEKNGISIDETTNCILAGNTTESVQLFEGKLKSNSNIEISNMKKSPIWVIGSDSTNMQLISNGTTGTINIITFSVKGIKNGDGKIEVTRLKKSPLAFTTKNLNVINIDSIVYNVTVGKSIETVNENYSNIMSDIENNNSYKKAETSSKEWHPQTGNIVIRYSLIIILITILTSALFCLKMKRKHNDWR